MARFEYVQRASGSSSAASSSGVIHFGVRDTQHPIGRNVVMHLYPNPDQVTHVRIHVQPDDGKWQPCTLASQGLSIDGVRANWNSFYAIIREQTEARNGGELPDDLNEQYANLTDENDKYDWRGSRFGGWNCEELATWVLTGKATAILGGFLGTLQAETGQLINWIQKG